MMNKTITKHFSLLALALAVVLCFSESHVAYSETSGLSAREERLITRASKSKRVKAKKTKLSDVCKKVSNISGLLVKITAGGHISRNDARYPGYSVICAGRCLPFPAKVYHCDGSEAFRMGYYGKWSGNGKSRGYCGSGGAPKCFTSAVRAKSKSLKCAGAGYVAVGGNSCMRINLNIDRNGGV